MEADSSLEHIVGSDRDYLSSLSTPLAATAASNLKLPTAVLANIPVARMLKFTYLSGKFPLQPQLTHVSVSGQDIFCYDVDQWLCTDGAYRTSTFCHLLYRPYMICFKNFELSPRHFIVHRDRRRNRVYDTHGRQHNGWYHLLCGTLPSARRRTCVFELTGIQKSSDSFHITSGVEQDGWPSCPRHR